MAQREDLGLQSMHARTRARTNVDVVRVHFQLAYEMGDRLEVSRRISTGSHLLTAPSSLESD